MFSNIKKQLNVGLAATMLVMAIVAAPLALATPTAAAPKDQICSGAGLGTGCNPPAGQPTVATIFQRVANVLIFLVGAVAVIMLIIGGMRYVISNGDQSQITTAKNTILYSVIGIIVAIAAYAIVAFVVRNIG